MTLQLTQGINFIVVVVLLLSFEKVEQAALVVAAVLSIVQKLLGKQLMGVSI